MAEPEAPPEPIHAIAPDGRQVLVQGDKGQAAIDEGYRLQTPEQFAAGELEKQEGLTGAAKTFGAHAASAATLGLSDVALGAVGGNEYRENARLRDITAPYAGKFGELTGLGATIALPGLGELGAARGAAEGATVLGRAAEGLGAAARYSPAGLVMRGGEAATELAGRGLEGLGLTGESLLGRAASSGIKGAVGGAVEGAGFGAGQALSEAALAPDGDYDGLAQKLWAGAIHGAEFGAGLGGGFGAGGELALAGARKLAGTSFVSKSIRDLADTKALKSLGYEEDAISAMRRENPEQVSRLGDAARSEESIGWRDSMKTKAEKLQRAHEDATENLATFRKGLDDARAPGDGVHVREVLDDAGTRVDALKENAKSAGAKRSAEKFGEEIRFFQEKFKPGEPASFEAAHDFGRTLDEMLTKIRKESPGAPGSNPLERELTRIRTDFHNQFETDASRVMEKTSPEFRDQYQAAKLRHAALEEVAPVAQAKVASLANQPGASLASQAAQLVGLAHLGPKGILIAAAHRALRSTQADQIIGQLAGKLGGLDQNVTRSMGRWASNARREATETTGRAASVGKHAVETAHKATEEYSSHKERAAAYFEKLRAVEMEARSAPGTLVHIPNAPKTEEAAENVRRRQANWLLSQAPKPPATIDNPMLARIARQTPPTTTEMLKWMRKVQTIEDPMSAVKAMEQGRLTTDHVAALEQSPAVLQMFRRAAMEQVEQHNKDMSFQNRIQLGVLVGAITDPSLRPESIAAGQAVYQKRRTAAGGQGGPGAPPPMKPTQTVPGKKPAGFDSALDQMESNTGRI